MLLGIGNAVSHAGRLREEFNIRSHSEAHGIEDEVFLLPSKNLPFSPFDFTPHPMHQNQVVSRTAWLTWIVACLPALQAAPPGVFPVRPVRPFPTRPQTSDALPQRKVPKKKQNGKPRLEPGHVQARLSKIGRSVGNLDSFVVLPTRRSSEP